MIAFIRKLREQGAVLDNAVKDGALWAACARC